MANTEQNNYTRMIENRAGFVSWRLVHETYWFCQRGRDGKFYVTCDRATVSAPIYSADSEEAAYRSALGVQQ